MARTWGPAAVAALLVAGLLHVLAGWFTLVSGLVAPLWAIVLLAAVWLAAAVVLLRVARRRPLAAPLVPIAYAVLWSAALNAGQRWLGWTP